MAILLLSSMKTREGGVSGVKRANVWFESNESESGIIECMKRVCEVFGVSGISKTTSKLYIFLKQRMKITG